MNESPLDSLHTNMVGAPVDPSAGQPASVADDPAMESKGTVAKIQREAPPKRDDAEPDEAIKKEVRQWWTRTGDTEDSDRLRRQLKRDTGTVYGADLGETQDNEEEQTEDRAKVVNRHIYRNAVQSMALVMPSNPEVKIEPAPKMPAFDLGTGLPKPDSDGIDPMDVAFAAGLDLAQKHLCRESDAWKNLRGFVQDAHHYEIVWLHVTWQRNYRTDSMNAGRLPDSQDQIARLETLTELYDLDEFDEQDPQYAEMSDLMKAIAAETELPVWEGPLIKSHPAHMVRRDPKIKRIEDWKNSEWISVDYLMSRIDVLKRWRKVDPDDLARAATYGPDGKRQGIDVRNDENVIAQRPVGTMLALGAGSSGDRQRAVSDWDTLLVRIVESKQTQTVYVLVEGLEYYADKYQPEDRPADWYEIEPFLLNRPPGNDRMEGLSDTELQAKEQDRLNRIDTDEDEDCRAARPKGLFDKDAIPDWDGLGISSLKAHEYKGVSFSDGDLSKSVVPIPGQQLHPEVHAMRRQTAMSNLRSMSGIPEQMTGAPGNPKFAEQIKVSDKGASVLMAFRTGLVNEILESAWRRLCHCIVVNADVEFMVMLVGENIRPIWSALPKDRLSIFRRLAITITASKTDEMASKDIISGLELLNTIDSAPPVPNSCIDKEKLLKTVARALKLPIDTDQLIKPNANDLAMRLGAQMAKDPSSIDPAVLQQLMQVLMPRAQQEIQKITAAGGPPGAGGPGAPGGGPPPPGGSIPPPNPSQPPQAAMPPPPGVPQQ